MEIPDLVRQHLGEEDVTATVNLGTEDVACFTPTRTLIYHGEGLLSDESVEEYGHNVERLDVSEGRRKTSFTLEYVDGMESFSVSNDRGDVILEWLLTGILRAADVLEAGETVQGTFRFSELTLIVTDARVVKHIGSSVWDEDFEAYPFEEVTGLDFEEGSVATQVVIGVDGRPQRIKAPNDEAPLVEQTLSEALFEYHDVSGLDALNEKVATDATTPDTPVDSDISLDDSISPLVGGSESGEAESATEPQGLDLSEDTGAAATDSATETTGSTTDDPPKSGSSAEPMSDSAETTVDADAGAVASPENQIQSPDSSTDPTAAKTGADSGEADSPPSSIPDSSPTSDVRESVEPGTPAEPDETGDSPGAATSEVERPVGSSTTEPEPPSAHERAGEDTGPVVTDDEMSLGGTEGATAESGEAPRTMDGIDPAEFEKLQRQVAKLTKATRRQNQLLKSHHQTLEELVDAVRDDG